MRVAYTSLNQSGYYFFYYIRSGSSLYILNIPQGFHLARYNALHSVERFTQTRALSRIDALSTRLRLWFPKHACYVYIFRISIIPYLILYWLYQVTLKKNRITPDQRIDKWKMMILYYTLYVTYVRYVIIEDWNVSGCSDSACLFATIDSCIDPFWHDIG